MLDQVTTMLSGPIWRRFRWNAMRRISRSPANCRANSTARSIATAPIPIRAPGAHWFVGDGMLHASISRTAASYRNRWVRTPKWQASMTPAVRCSGLRRPKTADAPATSCTDSGVANTTSSFMPAPAGAGRGPSADRDRSWHADRLALRLCRRHRGPFTAHPKIDPVTGEMVFSATTPRAADPASRSDPSMRPAW